MKKKLIVLYTIWDTGYIKCVRVHLTTERRPMTIWHLKKILDLDLHHRKYYYGI